MTVKELLKITKYDSTNQKIEFQFIDEDDTICELTDFCGAGYRNLNDNQVYYVSLDFDINIMYNDELCLCAKYIFPEETINNSEVIEFDVGSSNYFLTITIKIINSMLGE